jgi:hypothetical protein
MKIKISSSVQKVQFTYRAKYNDWIINVNGEPVCRFDRMCQGQMPMDFITIGAAVRYAKGKQLIPFEFEDKSLIENTEIEIIT